MERYSSIATRRAGVCFLLALFMAVLVGASSELHAAPPQLEKAKGGECVRSPEWMRHNHMDFLKHKRELTVREGLRIPSESFLQCAECHTSRNHFCDRCHAYVGVAPDCFQCHNYPK